MASLVQALQVLSGILWLLPAIQLAPAVWRTWQGRANRMAILATPTFFIALLQTGFVVRWLLWPHSMTSMGGDELASWAGLYATSCACALATFYRAWLTRADR